MTALLEAIKDAKETIEHLFKGDVAAWSLGGSARAKATLEKLEQAIAQEQAVRSCVSCKYQKKRGTDIPCECCSIPHNYLKDNRESKK